jgi:hypothetical protein
MPRHPNIETPTRLTLVLPASVRQQLDKHLHNPSLGKIPVGAYQAFFLARIQEFFARGGR